MTKSTKAPPQNSSGTPVPAPAKKPTKAELVRNLLASPDGVTLTELMEATGWQAHSVRAALSMLKKAGTTIERLPKHDGTPAARYRIVTDPALQTETAPPTTTLPDMARSDAPASGTASSDLSAAKGERA